MFALRDAAVMSGEASATNSNSESLSRITRFSQRFLVTDGGTQNASEFLVWEQSPYNFPLSLKCWKLIVSEVLSQS